MSVGALEPQFYKELVKRLKSAGFDDIPSQFPEDAEAAKKRMSDIFLSKTRSEWQTIFDGTDACVAPVLSMDEAAAHPHNVARSSFLSNSQGQSDPGPAPRLSRTPAVPQNNKPEPAIGENSISILEQFGYSPDEIKKLVQSKVVYQETDINSKL